MPVYEDSPDTPRPTRLCPACLGTGRATCTARGCGAGCWNCKGNGWTPCRYIGCGA